MKKTISFLLVGIIAILGFLFFRKGTHSKSEVSENVEAQNQIQAKSGVKSPSVKAKESKVPQENAEKPLERRAHQKASIQVFQNKQVKLSGESKKMVTYRIDNGVAVFQGDMVLGEVTDLISPDALTGQVPEPQIRTWPTNEIPFFIQADLPNHERVLEALRMFSGTRIRFVPYVSQSDAIVFESKEGVCKSYVGYIGGLQKIYLSDKCGPTEIAHEIMHSLGFVHEQNRSDRDEFIQVFWDNIDPEEKINFEKFSDFAMKASGVSSFDFESIMIYPDTMFSLNQNLTMKPLHEGQKIIPSDVLSAKDIERLNKIY